MQRLLIVEDDLTYGTLLQTWLRKQGFDVARVSAVDAATDFLSRTDEGNEVDLILSDWRLPDHDGLFLLAWLTQTGYEIPFIMMTSYADVQHAVEAMKMGACDYIAKPCQPDVLLKKIKEALVRKDEETVTVDEIAGTEDIPTYIEGKSTASRQLYEYVHLVAPTPMAVLILGASGTGKEYVARCIHDESARKDGPFFALDCGAIPREIAASELFGHVKGAFTGADSDKKGAFEWANGGTLFLDEVGNLSYEVQVQLLRALQERKVRPVGGNREIEVDIRLVSATNSNLSQLASEGTYREDLFHRLNEFTIYMPELRERGSDLFLFADLFMKQANRELGRNVKGFDAEAAEMLARYTWPGNLRELKNVVKRATLLAKGDYIHTAELSPSIYPMQSEPVVPALYNADEEAKRIQEALRQTGGNKSKAAQMLGIDRKTLYNKLQKYNLIS